MYIPDTLEDAALHLARVKQAALQITTQQKQAEAAPGMHPDLQSGLMGAGLGAGAGGLLWLMNRRKRKTNPLGSLLTGAALGGLGGLAYQHVPKLLEATQKEIQVPPEQARAAALEKLRASAGKLKEHGVPSWINAGLAWAGVDPMHTAETVKNTTGINVVPQPNSPNSEVMKEILVDGVRENMANPIGMMSHVVAPIAAGETLASYRRNNLNLAGAEATSRSRIADATKLQTTAATARDAAAPAVGTTPTAAYHQALADHAAATSQVQRHTDVENLRNTIAGGGLAGFRAHLNNKLTGRHATDLNSLARSGAATSKIPGWAQHGLVRTPLRAATSIGLANTIPFATDAITRAFTPTANLPTAPTGTP